MARKTEVKDPKILTTETSSQRILLEEFRLLQAGYINNRNQGIERMNYFITASSVAIGGVLIFGSNSSNLPVVYFKYILLATLILLAVIGLDLFSYLVQRDVSADRYLRGLARIRRYFIELDPQIKDYFVMKYADTPTYFITKKGAGILRVSQLIDGFLLGLAITILLTLTQITVEVAIWIGVVVAGVIFMILEAAARRRYRQEQKKTK